MDAVRMNPKPRPAPAQEEPQASDETLALRFLSAKRDQGAFAELIRRQQDFVFRVAFARCGSEGLAEEIVQETFLQLAQPSCRFRDEGPGSFRGWLARVASRVAYRMNRAEKRSMHRIRERTALEKKGAPASEPPAAESVGVLKEALAELEEDLRVPVVLYYQEGLTQEDIGRMVGVSQSMIARRISQGLDLLRRQLETRGVHAAVALPVLLSTPQMLAAPAALRDTLAQLASNPAAYAAKLGTFSRRLKARAPQGSNAYWIVPAIAAASAVALLAWTMMPPPEVQSRQAVAEPAPVEPQKESPKQAPVKVEETPALVRFVWNFDAGASGPFIPRDRLIPGPERKGWPLPEWMPRAGRDGGGAMHFGPQGASLLINLPVPTSGMPIKVSLRLHAATKTGISFGINSKFKVPPDKAKDDRGIVTGHSGDILDLKPGQWHRWERFIEIQEGAVYEHSTQDGQPIGPWGKTPLADAYNDPEVFVYFELYGKEVLVDDLVLEYLDQAASRGTR